MAYVSLVTNQRFVAHVVMEEQTYCTLSLSKLNTIWMSEIRISRFNAAY